jgi:hypothetical protein
MDRLVTEKSCRACEERGGPPAGIPRSPILWQVAIRKAVAYLERDDPSQQPHEAFGSADTWFYHNDILQRAENLGLYTPSKLRTVITMSSPMKVSLGHEESEAKASFELEAMRGQLERFIDRVDDLFGPEETRVDYLATMGVGPAIALPTTEKELRCVRWGLARLLETH